MVKQTAAKSLRVLIAFTLTTPLCVCAQQTATALPAATRSGETQRSAATAGTQTTLSFEVATIKPAAPSPDGHTHINYPPGDRFSAQNITLLALLSWAYRLPQNQILEAPSWLASTRFDLQATLDTQNDPSNLSGDEDQTRKRQMVESLLADRCNLKLHPETRVLPAYDLVLARTGSRLQPSAVSGRSIDAGSAHLNVQGLTLRMIAEQLSYVAGRVVVDKTGLPGRYDLKLRWSPDDAVATDEQSPPTLFTAIQEQLGLKLDPAKEPIPVLVIDHIETPSAN